MPKMERLRPGIDPADDARAHADRELKRLLEQVISAPHVQGYPLGWLTGHWEFDKVLIRAYRMIPEKDMRALRGQLRQVRLTPYTSKLSDGRWSSGVSLGNTGTVLVRPDVLKWGPFTTLLVILHELAHQVDDVRLSPIMAELSYEGGVYHLVSEWAAVLRVADWGYGFQLGQALRGERPPHVPSEKEARRIAHRIRSICGSLHGLVRDWEEWREICTKHPEWGITVEDIEAKYATDDEKAALDEWRWPKTLLAMIDTVILVDRLFDLWGYERMNPKFVPKMMRVYHAYMDRLEL